MKSTRSVLLAIAVLIVTSLACNAAVPTAEPTAAPTLTASSNPVPTVIIEPTSSEPQTDLPENDAEVPRVPVEQAKAAFDTGDAIIVDVRGTDAYNRSHVKGALDISLSAIQTDPLNLNLDKNRWIITYCT